MIKIELTSAITVYLFLGLLILFLWIFSEARKKAGFKVKNENYLWQCPICLYIYIDSSGSNISRCPMCGSLNKRNDSGYNIIEGNKSSDNKEVQ
ncbi:MAG TPA: hypothetical protein P5065_01410 [Candidatus Ratteibacteria bacterium]|jgi:hypothetical protein|uniref:Hydrogenase nickel incorporation protein HypA n=1 Tax=candidate division TA06 bacterium ADurb.Bin131 TaxID=1852827 RepID=A0A1V6C9A7_UNCT6|nr:MAG: hypothetical protein BWX89_00971 [candidate division TA06 bacterium ADurb.Bin131]HOC02321.1 hypothetical protein [bacterium]HRS05687.1 hypothetical protein [Candidatus Ratteibacteria bacterium]HON04912.1 hypothetical protein [bacterium]HOQ82036.1 hypothetical protein [bacterium]